MVDAYTKESRLEMYREQGAAKEEKKRRERKRLGDHHHRIMAASLRC